MLRSLRYGEADRILHLYTATRGRVGAIAKGVRRTRSRFGGRLEPFSRVRLICHEGRGDLLTVTSVETLDAHAALRDHAATLDSAARACDAVARVFETEEPHPAVYNLLANELALLAQAPRARHARQRARVPPEAAGRGGARPGARRVRLVRLARAPGGLLARGRRRRLRRLRGRLVPDRAGDPRLHDARARPTARADAGRRRRARCARPSARSARRSSTTPTCGCARRSRDDRRRVLRGAPARAARSASSRRWLRAPTRRSARVPEEDCAPAHARSSATATASSTPRRSGA